MATKYVLQRNNFGFKTHHIMVKKLTIVGIKATALDFGVKNL